MLQLLVGILLICLVFYLMSSIADAPEVNDLPKPEVKVTTGNVNNSINIKDSNINIPNVVATGLTWYRCCGSGWFERWK